MKLIVIVILIELNIFEKKLLVRFTYSFWSFIFMIKLYETIFMITF